MTTRVRYPETDRMGVAWHGHYLAWFELGRTEWMREAGCPYGALEESRGIYFPVISVGADFRRPARYDEVLEVRTKLVSFSRVRVRFEYEILDGDGGSLATGFSEHAAVDAEGRPIRLPAEIQHLLSGGNADRA